MIQDISPYKFHNEYAPVEPKPSDMFLVFDKMNVLSKVVQDDDKSADEESKADGVETKPADGNVQVTFPTFEELGDHCDQAMEDAIYLFSVDDTPFFLLLDLESLEGFDFNEIHTLYNTDVAWVPLVVATGIHLNNWYKDNKFCGRCGKPMSHHKELRAMKCTCGNLQFPKIAPVILAGIVKGDKIVATRYKGRPYKGFALNAGFVEIGESLEEALVREVKEEVGLTAGKIHYYASQPWGHTGIVMAGYFVEIEGDDTITMDENELSEAFWISRDELPEQTNKMSLTATMFEAFRTGKVKF